MIGTFYYTAKDQLGKDYKETLGDVDLSVTEDSASRTTDAQKLDTFARAVCNLTNNTYVDSFVEYSYSIDEILAEGAAGE